MDAVVHRITVPRLERLDIRLYSDFTLSVPHLPRFLNTTKNLRFDSATYVFSLRHVLVRVYLREEAEVYALSMTVFHTGRTEGQIFSPLSQKLSTVEHLSLSKTRRPTCIIGVELTLQPSGASSLGHLYT